jgi:hypothetical protein
MTWTISAGRPRFGFDDEARRRQGALGGGGEIDDGGVGRVAQEFEGLRLDSAVPARMTARVSSRLS